MRLSYTLASLLSSVGLSRFQHSKTVKAIRSSCIGLFLNTQMACFIAPDGKHLPVFDFQNYIRMAFPGMVNCYVPVLGI